MMCFDWESTRWGTSQATVTLSGGGGSRVVSIPSTIQNGVEAIAYVVSDLNANLAGTGVWSWAYAALDTTGRVLTTITHTGQTFTVVANTDFAYCLGLPSKAVAGSTWSSTQNPVGMWRPKAGFALHKVDLRLAADGDCGGPGVCVRPSAPALSLAVPDLETVATFGEAHQLSRVLTYASSPRYAYVCSRHDSVFTLMAIGEISREDAGMKHYRLTFDARVEA